MTPRIKIYLLAGTMMLAAAPAFAGPTKVTVTDPSFDVGAGMFAYTEFELSGEPLAEGLGLDLDVLDPDQADKPTAFDFASGIDSYEYSEEAMYAVNYQSRLGPHLVNGPVNAAMGGTMASLGKRFLVLAKAVGFAPDELPQNMYPISLPLDRGVPDFAEKVDVTPVGTDEKDILTHKGHKRHIKTFTPAYFRDYKTLGWRKDGMDMALTPVAYGGELLKDALWSQDFLGAMHVIKSDEEVDNIPSSTFDHDGKHALGGAAADGMNGMFLTEITWDKMRLMRDRLGFDGKTLGAAIKPDYDPSKHPVWFPNKIAVTLVKKNGVNALGSLKVTDGGSSLRSDWMLLWALAEVYGYSDQRTANTNQNKAFLAVFDGHPFPAAPAVNRGLNPKAYVKANDPFSLTQDLSNLVFKNLLALHFDKAAGTLVDQWAAGKMGSKITAFDAAYAIVALDIYERAIDALPVGYASASSGKPLGTEAGKHALALIKTEANFILSKLIGADGLVADDYKIGKGAGSGHSLGAQFAVIRGLSAAFVATGDNRYRTAARKLYHTVNAKMVDKATGLFNPTPGKAFKVTSWTAGAVSGGLHALLEILSNKEGETDPALDRSALTKRYTTWFHIVARGMQRAEWLNDTGEEMVKGDKTGDINENGIKGITFAGGAHGVAAVMAAEVKVTPGQ